jgi:hypothetical protein
MLGLDRRWNIIPFKESRLLWVNDNLLDNRWWESWDHRPPSIIEQVVIHPKQPRFFEWNDIPSSVKQHSEMSFFVCVIEGVAIVK